MSTGGGVAERGADVAIGAITFDFWNTLIAANPRNREEFAARIDSMARDAGVDVAPGAAREAASAVWKWFTTRWERNVTTSSVQAAEHLVRILTAASASGSGGTNTSSFDERALIAGLDEILEQGVDPAATTTAEGIGEVLESLASSGVTLGIICDVGLTPSYRLRGYLEHHGLLAHFSAWSFSDEVGVFKPDPAIFEHALTSLGIEGASRYAHVGDLKRTDIAGARAAGWTPVRYRGLNDDDARHPDADIVIDRHADLAERLGL